MEGSEEGWIVQRMDGLGGGFHTHRLLEEGSRKKERESEQKIVDQIYLSESYYILLS